MLAVRPPIVIGLLVLFALAALATCAWIAPGELPVLADAPRAVRTPTAIDEAVESVSRQAPIGAEVERHLVRSSPPARPSLRGSVVTHDGDRLPGATVQARASDALDEAGGDIDLGTTTTDGNGDFVVSVACLTQITPLRRRALELAIDVSDPNHLSAHWSTSLTDALDSGRIDFELPSSDGVLVGHVVSPAGSPVADATVFTDESGRSRDTDASGRFELEVDEPDELYAVHPRFGASEVVHVDATNGRVEPIELRLVRPLGVISGRVRDVSGAGVPAHEVLLRRCWDPPSPDGRGDSERLGLDEVTVLTDADGRFRVCCLKPGRYEVDWSGFDEWPSHPRDDRSGSVEAETGSPPLDLVVPLIHLDVDVVDRNDEPLRGATVLARLTMPDGGLFTDQLGTEWREIENHPARLWLAAGWSGTVESSVPGSAIARETFRIDAPGSNRVKLVLRALRAGEGVRLHAADATGRPVENMTVHVTGLRLGSEVALPLHGSVDAGFRVPDGILLPLPPGAYRLQLTPAVDRSRPLLPVELEVRAADPAPRFDVRFPLGARVAFVAPRKSFLPPPEQRIARCGRSSDRWLDTELHVDVIWTTGMVQSIVLHPIDGSRRTPSRFDPETDDVVGGPTILEPGATRFRVWARDAEPTRLDAVLVPGLNWFAVERVSGGGLSVRPVH